MGYRFLVSFTLAVGLICSGCTGSSADANSEPLSQAQVGDHVLELEIADTPNERAQGLMYRRELADNRGMLFVFDETREQTFWMKNTPLSLDIVFLDEQLRVVGVVEGTTPFSTATVTIGKPSRYVLEVRAGRARALGLTEIGAKLQWPAP